MDRLKFIRVQNKDGTYGYKIPVAVGSNNVFMTNGDNLQFIIDNLETDAEEKDKQISDARVGYDGTIYPDLSAHMNAITALVQSQRALAIGLSNDMQIIPTDEDGKNGDFTKCQTDVYIYYGGKDITGDENIVWDIIFPDSVNASWSSIQHKIRIFDLYEDQAYIQIHVIYRQIEARRFLVLKKVKDGAAPIIVEIESSAGNIFKNRGINTTLTATVKKGEKDITDTVTNFRWLRFDENGNLDSNWSRFNTRTITLTPADVWNKAIFKCEVSFD